MLYSLNEEQRLAATTTEGYVRVVAGPGTGKTKTLTARYCYLVNKLNINPKNILCVTFTNKAAFEMKQRICKELMLQALPFVCTFHSFCAQFLRQEYSAIHWIERFLILDRNDTQKIIEEGIKELSLKGSDITVKKISKQIRLFKQDLLYSSDLINPDSSILYSKFLQEKNDYRKIFYYYIYQQKKNYALDFDDLILQTVFILNKEQRIREKWQNQFKYVLVDEFQDVSKNQYILAEILAYRNKNLFIVGDSDQNIYSFRGSDVNFFLNFDKVHQDCQTIILNKNYRSIPQIIKASSALISNNKKRISYELIPTRDVNNNIEWFHGKTDKDEITWIVKKIQELKRNNVKLNDIAIIYRSNIASKFIEEALIKENIAYTILGDISFFQRKEIKDIIAYLRLIQYGDDFSFKRIINFPHRGFGAKKMERVKFYAKKQNLKLLDALIELVQFNSKIFAKDTINFVKNIVDLKKDYASKKISDILEQIYQISKYKEYLAFLEDEERLENLATFSSSVIEFEKEDTEYSLADFLEKFSLLTNANNENDKDKVKLMTAHSAKGLEFPVVFVCFMNEGIFPSRKVKDEDEMEEERRLAYVACTRAKDRLFITSSKGGDKFVMFLYPSRFITEIGDTNLKVLTKYTIENYLPTNSGVAQPVMSPYEEKEIVSRCIHRRR